MICCIGIPFWVSHSPQSAIDVSLQCFSCGISYLSHAEELGSVTCTCLSFCVHAGVCVFVHACF